MKYSFLIFTITFLVSCRSEKEINKNISIKFYSAFNQEEVFGKLYECDSVTNLKIKKIPVDTTTISYHYYPIINRSIYYDSKVNPILSKLFFYFDDSERVPYITRDVYIANALSKDTAKIRTYLNDKICENLYSEKLFLKWYNIDKDSTICDLVLLKNAKDFLSISTSDLKEIHVAQSPSILRQLNNLLGDKEDNDLAEFNISFILSDARIKELGSLKNNFQTPFLIEVYILNKKYIAQGTIRELMEKKLITISRSNFKKEDIETLKVLFQDKVKFIN